MLKKSFMVQARDLRSEAIGKFLKRSVSSPDGVQKESLEVIRSISPWSVGYRSGLYITTDKAKHSFDMGDSVIVAY